MFATPAHMIGTFVPVPCTQVKVDAWDLGMHLLAAGFADMAQQGLITLQLVEATTLFVLHTTHVSARIAPGAGPRLPQNGLAGWLAKGIAAHDGATVHQIIRAAYGADYLDPIRVLTGLAAQELISLGYYEDTVHEIGGIIGGIRKMVHAAPAIEHIPVPRCERFATLREPAAQVQQMLNAARSRDPHLWELLYKEMRHAVSSRVEQQRSTANIG